MQSINSKDFTLNISDLNHLQRSFILKQTIPLQNKCITLPVLTFMYRDCYLFPNIFDIQNVTAISQSFNNNLVVKFIILLDELYFIE